MSLVKDEAKRLIDDLPEHATWDDIMYEMYVKKKINQAIEAADSGDVLSPEEAKRQILSE